MKNSSMQEKEWNQEVKKTQCHDCIFSRGNYCLFYMAKRIEELSQYTFNEEVCPSKQKRVDKP